MKKIFTSLVSASTVVASAVLASTILVSVEPQVQTYTQWSNEEYNPWSNSYSQYQSLRPYQRQDDPPAANNQQMKNRDDSIAMNNMKNASDAQLKESEKKFPQDGAITLQDRRINAAIREKLNAIGFTKSNNVLIIKSDNGNVTIRGVVNKIDDIKKITDEIKSVKDVQSVNSQLTVKK